MGQVIKLGRIGNMVAMGSYMINCQNKLIKNFQTRLQVDLAAEGRFRTVGGRTLDLSQGGNGLKVQYILDVLIIHVLLPQMCKLQVNGVGVGQVVRSGNAQLCILDKLLFIRSRSTGRRKAKNIHLRYIKSDISSNNPSRPEDIEIAVERAEGVAQ